MMSMETTDHQNVRPFNFFSWGYKAGSFREEYYSTEASQFLSKTLYL